MFHEEVKDRWNKFSIFEQMANIGIEVGRIFSWKNKNNENMWKNAFYRSLELIDLTASDEKNKNSLKELLRIREVLADFTIGDNLYNLSTQSWENYFYYYNLASRK